MGLILGQGRPPGGGHGTTPAFLLEDHGRRPGGPWSVGILTEAPGVTRPLHVHTAGLVSRCEGIQKRPKFQGSCWERVAGVYGSSRDAQKSIEDNYETILFKKNSLENKKALPSA